MTLKDLYTEFTRSSGVSTDTRSLVKNQLFFALQGENYNANAFIREALDKGSRIVVCSDPSFTGLPGVMVVDSVLSTLQELARMHREKTGVRVHAITGSNGKTTTKELIARVLEKKYRVLYTRGNLNNHIGVPLTLLRIKDEEIAVVEMGANHPGEIAGLCEIALPDTGLITNVGKAHLEGFGSLDGVRKAKGELYDYLAQHDREGIVDVSDPVLKAMAAERSMQYFSYGLDEYTTVSGKLAGQEKGIRGILFIDGQKYDVHSEMTGTYNFRNILAAAATGVYYGVDPVWIVEAVNSYVPENNRSQVLEGKSNRIILDAYNANPTSMMLSLQDFMFRDKGASMVILGDMLELGKAGMKEHQAVLDWLNENGPEEVILVGEIFFSFSGDSRYDFMFFRDLGACIGYLESVPVKDRRILLKGSRKIMLEKATKYLLDC